MLENFITFGKPFVLLGDADVGQKRAGVSSFLFLRQLSGRFTDLTGDQWSSPSGPKKEGRIELRQGVS